MCRDGSALRKSLETCLANNGRLQADPLMWSLKRHVMKFFVTCATETLLEQAFCSAIEGAFKVSALWVWVPVWTEVNIPMLVPWGSTGAKGDAVTMEVL